ncbi:MAG: futalosine hydrolase [Candidatus Methanoperedens sp.]|jgi:futalosine hydrolase|nr:futalosine hydrolase [Candidatus Methanoperedens sp.]PKL53313.1 MAG: futalosine hydrolase [Candidatus Methanoperedenaceae archaeon HGW-Methanoperedenaceae-1]
MQNIALITATSIESHELRRSIHPEPEDKSKVVYEGELHGKTVFLTHSGVGKVNAAHSVTILLENHDIDLVVLFGIGGAYTRMKAGDIAVAESENYAEEGVLTKDGWQSMELTGFPLLRKEKEYYNTFPLDMELSRFAMAALEDTGLNVHSGNFVTVSQCSGTTEAGRMLMNRFNGICENTEGAAVVHICAMYGVPVIEVRGISNIVEDRDMGKWDLKSAASNCCKAVAELVKRLE